MTQATECPDLMQRVMNALNVGASVEDIYAMLKGEGCSDYCAYLNYIAGKMLSVGNE